MKTITSKIAKAAKLFVMKIILDEILSSAFQIYQKIFPKLLQINMF